PLLRHRASQPAPTPTTAPLPPPGPPAAFPTECDTPHSPPPSAPKTTNAAAQKTTAIAPLAPPALYRATSFLSPSLLPEPNPSTPVAQTVPGSLPLHPVLAELAIPPAPPTASVLLTQKSCRTVLPALPSTTLPRSSLPSPRSLLPAPRIHVPRTHLLPAPATLSGPASRSPLTVISPNAHTLPA